LSFQFRTTFDGINPFVRETKFRPSNICEILPARPLRGAFPELGIEGEFGVSSTWPVIWSTNGAAHSVLLSQ